MANSNYDPFKPETVPPEIDGDVKRIRRFVKLRVRDKKIVCTICKTSFADKHKAFSHVATKHPEKWIE